MVQKRPVGHDDPFEVSIKHPRQTKYPDNLVPILEFVPSEVVPRKLHTVENRDGNVKSVSDSIPAILPSEGKGLISPLSPFVSSWDVSCGIDENDALLEEGFHTLSPEYFTSELSVQASSHAEDSYSILLNHPPAKSVSVGSDYQAIIQEWSEKDTRTTEEQIGTSGSNNMSEGLESEVPTGDDNRDKFIGTCVIPMPDLDKLSVDDTQNVGFGRLDCSCEDRGSVRCVRQHIVEAREKMKQTLGQDIFLELGFCGMGEVAAVKWDIEEERLFNEIIFSHPASLDMNFWEHLAAEFPYRTTKDIVNYYFNVFILRRRAEQNRCHPMNIDSDDDEWQGNDDDIGPRMTDEYEDRVVDSRSENKNSAYESCGDISFANSRGVTTDMDVRYRLPFSTLGDRSEHHLAWHDGCTLTDTTPGFLSSQKDDPMPGCLNGIQRTHEYCLEPCDAKVWDPRYTTWTENKNDLLPSSSTMDEVFGRRTLNYNSKKEGF